MGSSIFCNTGFVILVIVLLEFFMSLFLGFQMCGGNLGLCAKLKFLNNSFMGCYFFKVHVMVPNFMAMFILLYMLKSFVNFSNGVKEVMFSGFVLLILFFMKSMFTPYYSFLYKPFLECSVEYVLVSFLVYLFFKLSSLNKSFFEALKYSMLVLLWMSISLGVCLFFVYFFFLFGCLFFYIFISMSLLSCLILFVVFLLLFLILEFYFLYFDYCVWCLVLFNFFITFFKVYTSFFYAHLFYFYMMFYTFMIILSLPVFGSKKKVVEPVDVVDLVEPVNMFSSEPVDPKLPYFINVINLSSSLEKCLKFFSSSSNSVVTFCSHKDYLMMNSDFSKFYYDGCFSLSKMSFFNYVCGNIIYSNICKIKGDSFVDSFYFLKYFSLYVIKLFLNKVSSGKFFCEGILLDVSVEFWLSVLNEDGTFKKDFLFYCEGKSDVIISGTACSIFIHNFDVLISNPVFMDYNVLMSEVSIISEFGYKDDDCVSYYISSNSKVICSEFGMSDNDFLSFSNSCKVGLGFEKFLSDGGSL